MKQVLVFLLLALFLSSHVHASCKAGEGDPYAPHPSPTQRVYTNNPSNPALDTSAKGGTTLDILSFNIQSGLTLTCSYDLSAQAQLMKGVHFFGLQEVDVNNDLRCNCNQPAQIADITGHTVLYLNTILYRTGLYGSALSSAFPILETRYRMFSLYSTEERGALAIRTTPPQLQGKTLWTINTHLQYDSEYIRLGQTADLVNFTKSIAKDFPDALFIVTGDYYVVPGLGSYANLEAYFMNAWTVFHGSSDGGATYPSDFPSNRFDHVWYKFPAGTNYKITVEVVDIHISDHRPLHVTFNFDAKSPGENGDTSAASALSTAAASASSVATTAAAASTAIATSTAGATSAALASTAAATSAAATTAATTAAAAATTSAAASTAAALAASTANLAASTAASAADSTTAAAAAAASVTSAAATSAAAIATTAAAATAADTTSASATTAAAATSAAATSSAASTFDIPPTITVTSATSAAPRPSSTTGSEDGATSSGSRVTPALLIATAIAFVIYM